MLINKNPLLPTSTTEGPMSDGMKKHNSVSRSLHSNPNHQFHFPILHIVVLENKVNSEFQLSVKSRKKILDLKEEELKDPNIKSLFR